MKDVILFDLGNTLLRYYTRNEFPEILREAIAEVQNYFHKAGLLKVSEESIWRRVEEENHEAKDNSVRPMEGRLTRIFQLDDSDEEIIMEAVPVFSKAVVPSASAR